MAYTNQQLIDLAVKALAYLPKAERYILVAISKILLTDQPTVQSAPPFLRLFLRASASLKKLQ